MTFSIGRAGLDITLEYPQTFSLNGGELQLTGLLSAATYTDAYLLRHQLLALTDSTDEPVIPIVWTGTGAEFTGYYACTAMSVHDTPASLVVSPYMMPWEGTFQKVPGFASPSMEAIAMATLLSNQQGVTGTEAYPMFGFPLAATEMGGVASITGTAFFSFPTANRTGNDGAIPILTGNIGGGAIDSIPGISVLGWTCTPANYYGGGCSVQVGTSFRTFVGRQNPGATLLTSALDSWRIENSLVRVLWDTTNKALSVQHHDGTVWDTAKSYIVYSTGTSQKLETVTGFRILRNTPEAVTVRLAMTWTAGSSYASDGAHATLDLTLRRGDRIAYVTPSVSSGLVAGWGIQRRTVEAATALSAAAPFTSPAGIRATANDASGNRYVILCPAGQTRDLVNGGVMAFGFGANQSVMFGVSSEIAGSAATAAVDDAITLALQFLAGATEKAYVVSR